MSIFDKIGKGIKKTAKKAEKGVEHAAKDVGKGVVNTANTVADGTVNVGKDIGKATSDIAQGKDPTHDFEALGKHIADTAVGTTQIFGNTVISVGKTAFDTAKHTVDLTEKEVVLVYHDTMVALTTVINTTEKVAEVVGHDIEVGAKYVFDESGKIIYKTLHYLEKFLMNELQKLFNSLVKNLEDEAGALEKGAKSGLNKVKDAALKEIHGVVDGAKDELHKLEGEVVDIEKTISKAVEGAVGDVVHDFEKVKTAVVKVEHDVERVTKSIPKFVKDEALWVIEEIGLTIAKESLKAIYSVANAYRKALKKLKSKPDLTELGELIDNTPLSINIGPIGLFYQNFAERADKICEVLLKYHHHPPPLKRANILEMAEALEPDFGMVDFSISASFLIVNTSTAKFDLQVPFIDKKLIKYVLNEIMKAAGIPAGDMSILNDDALGGLDLGDLDTSDLTFDDVNADISDDATPDTVDATYDPNTPLVGDGSSSDSDPANSDDLPELSDADIDDILADIDKETLNA